MATDWAGKLPDDGDITDIADIADEARPILAQLVEQGSVDVAILLDRDDRVVAVEGAPPSDPETIISYLMDLQVGDSEMVRTVRRPVSVLPVPALLTLPLVR